jgi:hypothetical protein
MSGGLTGLHAIFQGPNGLEQLFAQRVDRGGATAPAAGVALLAKLRKARRYEHQYALALTGSDQLLGGGLSAAPASQLMSNSTATSAGTVSATGVKRCDAPSSATPVSTLPPTLCGAVAVNVVADVPGARRR